jgi:hypothetical protein
MSFRAAVEARDLEAMMAELAPDVVIHSPISRYVRFEGKPRARELFADVLEVFEDIRYLDEVHGDGVVVYFLQARVGRREFEEVALLRFAADGLVREMRIFIRPMPGLAAVAAALGPRLARRRGRLRAALVAAFARPLAVVVGAGDRASVKLV